jgi:hypothetical protein
VEISLAVSLEPVLKIAFATKFTNFKVDFFGIFACPALGGGLPRLSFSDGAGVLVVLNRKNSGKIKAKFGNCRRLWRDRQ